MAGNEAASAGGHVYRYSVEDVARRLHVSARRVNALAKSGQLACVQVTPRVRIFTEQQISDFEMSRSVQITQPVPLSLVDKKTSESLSSKGLSADKPKQRRARNAACDVGIGSEMSRARIRKEMQQWR